MAMRYTTDKDEIRAWIEEHNGVPVVLRDTEEDEEERPDMLRISFGTEAPDTEEMNWEEFFERFDNQNLALAYNGEVAEGTPPEFEFIDRDRARDEYAPETELPDSGDIEVLRENTTPDSDAGGLE